MAEWESASPNVGGWEAASAPENKSFLEEGYLGRVAKAAGEGAAKLGMSKEEIEAEKKAFPDPKEEPSPGVVESLALMGKQLVEHPLDSLVGLGKGLAADPELLFPALWETAPERLAASLAKTAKTTKKVEDVAAALKAKDVVDKTSTAKKVLSTGVRGAVVGAAAEAGAGAAEGKVDKEKVAATAVMFGLMGAGTRGAAEGLKGGWQAAKGSVIKDTEALKELDPVFEKSRIKPDESISDVIGRSNEKKKLAQTAFKNKETGEIEGSGPKHDEAKKAEQLPSDNKGIEQEANKKISTLNDPPKDYHPKDAIEAKHWAETQLKSVKDEDARASLQILIKQADEIIKGDQHPSVVKEHGIEIKRNDNYIDVVKLPKDLQKQGLGSKIVANLESDIKKEGHKDAFLIATPDSVEFWRKQGYRITSKGDEGIQMSKTFKEEATGPLAKTDKENHISLNHTAIENDFSSGFKYIFDASTETGKQKQIVFNKLGITKEGFSKLITSVGDYKNFLRAHEESHVAHNDRESYPKTKEGKIDLFNPKAIEIETRATKDALNSVAKHKEQTGTHTPEHENSKYNQGFLDNEGNFLDRKEALARAVETKQIPADHFLDELHSTDLRDNGEEAFQTKANVSPDDMKEANAKIDKDVNDTLGKANQDNASVLTAAVNVIRDSINEIRSINRKAEIWGNTIRTLIPNIGKKGDNPIHRERVTRAMESELKRDKIYTDKEKHDELYGTGEDILDERTGRPSGYKEEGAFGRLKGARTLIAQGKTPKNFKGTLEEYIKKTDAFEYSIRKWASEGSEEHAIAPMKLIVDRMDAVGKAAKAAGLIEELRNNYVAHVLDFSKSKLDIKEQQALLDKIYNAPKDSKLVKDFTEARKYEFLRSLEEAVAGTGVVVHTDIATIAEAYEKSMLTAIVHKKMIDHFTALKSPDERGYLLPAGPEADKAGYIHFQGKGSKPLEGLRVHPDLVDPMKFMFQQDDPELLLRALGSITMLTKVFNTVGSLFHATNLGIAGATADPMLALKEIFSGGAGIRAATKAFRTDENHALIDSFIKEGLMAGTEDIKRTIVADMGQKVDQLLSKFAPADKSVRAVQHLTDPFDKHILQNLNAFTWDYMHTGQKINMAMNKFAKAKAKNPEIPDQQLIKEIASHVNTTFGGLDWMDVANQVQNQYLKAFAMKAAGMRGRAWGQVLLFAPDWTVSTLRTFTRALPKEMAKPQNWEFRKGIKGMYNPITESDFARKYVLNTAIGYFTIQNGINIALSGHPIWENKDPTRVDNGDGTTMQVAKHSMETAEWVKDPLKTLGNKLGFFPKAIGIGLTGRQFLTQNAPKVKPLWEGYAGQAAGDAGAIAKEALPFQIGAAIQAPEGAGLSRAVGSALGMPTYGVSREIRSAAIKAGKADAKRKKEEAQWEN
jgi:hypothetical protein